MMRTSGIINFVATVVLPLLLFLFLAWPSEADISCSTVIKDLRPCVTYLVNGTGNPPSDCCSGAASLAAAVTSSADRVAVCKCIKSTAEQINPKEQNAQAIPTVCGITLPVAVSANVDCSKVS